MSSDATTDHDMPCATGAADCTAFDELNVDARTGQLKLKDTPTDQPVAIARFEGFFADASPNHTRVVRQPEAHPPDSSPALNVLYCVYLI